MAIFAPIAGRLSDRFPVRVIASVERALCTTGLLIVTFIAADTGLAVVGGGFVVIGLGFLSSPNTGAIRGSVESRRI